MLNFIEEQMCRRKIYCLNLQNYKRWQKIKSEDIVQRKKKTRVYGLFVFSGHYTRNDCL